MFELVKVRNNEEIASGIFRLKLESMIKAKPGQFVMLEPSYPFSVVPRPFSVYRQNAGSIEVVIKKVGPNTEAYNLLKPGDSIVVSGPLGNPIVLPPAARYLLIAGGMGLAGLYFLAKDLIRRGQEVGIYFGTRGIEEQFGVFELARLGCEVKTITENNLNRRGYVIDLLDEELAKGDKDFVIVACGPKPMLKKVAQLAETYHIDCKVIIEEMMACGVGSCKSCAVFVNNSHMPLHVCHDGPTFDASIIDWEKFCPEEKVEIVERKPLIKDPFKTVLVGQKGRILKLDYPIMNGAGTLDTLAIESKQVDVSKFGAILTKGICMDARPGNPMPRICEINGGFLNRIGLEGWGIAEFKQRYLPIWQSFGKKVIVTIFGKSINEYGVLADIFQSLGIEVIEMNLSCGNTEGRIFAQSEELTYQAVERVRQLFSGFLMVKLTPMVSNIVEIARAAVSGGADALTLINTPLGMSIDVMTGKSKIAGNYAGMSGGVIRPLGVRMVHQVASENLGVPIVGVGGIANGYDAAEYLMAGASAIQIGTALFSNLEAGITICNDLMRIAFHHGVEKISDLIGMCK